MGARKHDASRCAADEYQDHGTGSMASLFELSANADFFDRLPLECDGMVNVASAVLDREGVPHLTHCGSMSVQGVGTIARHCWIRLPAGQILDLRARMWLGDDARVPHGVFHPKSGISYMPTRRVSCESQRNRLHGADWTIPGIGSVPARPALASQSTIIVIGLFDRFRTPPVRERMSNIDASDSRTRCASLRRVTTASRLEASDPADRRKSQPAPQALDVHEPASERRGLSLPGADGPSPRWSATAPRQGPAIQASP